MADGRWVLSAVVKEGSESECLSSWGREFQRDGPAMEKALSPPPGPVLGEVRGRGDIQWCVLGVFSMAHRSREHRLHGDHP